MSELTPAATSNRHPTHEVKGMKRDKAKQLDILFDMCRYINDGRAELVTAVMVEGQVQLCVEFKK